MTTNDPSVVPAPGVVQEACGCQWTGDNRGTISDALPGLKPCLGHQAYGDARAAKALASIEHGYTCTGASDCRCCRCERDAVAARLEYALVMLHDDAKVFIGVSLALRATNIVGEMLNAVERRLAMIRTLPGARPHEPTNDTQGEG